MPPVKRRFSTGLPFLDRRLGGGISVSSVVGFLAPPTSQSQLLLRTVTEGRPLLYLSTSHRNETELETWLAAPRHQDASITVEYTPPESLLTNVTDLLQAAPPEAFVVIDSADSLEDAPRVEYVSFLNELKQWLLDHDSVAFLHCLDATDTPSHRSLTFNWVDQAWWLQTQLLSQEISNRLYVTKARADRALEEPIPLVLTDQVRIDTSRNI